MENSTKYCSHCGQQKVKSKMKKIFSVLLLICLVLPLVVSCSNGGESFSSPGGVAVTGLTIDEDAVYMFTDQTDVRIPFTVTPTNASTSNLSFTADREGITIDQSGLVDVSVLKDDTTVMWLSPVHTTVTISCGGKTDTCDLYIHPDFQTLYNYYKRNNLYDDQLLFDKTDGSMYVVKSFYPSMGAEFIQLSLNTFKGMLKNINESFDIPDFVVENSLEEENSARYTHENLPLEMLWLWEFTSSQWSVIVMWERTDHE